MLYDVNGLIDTMYCAVENGLELRMVATKNYGFEGDFHSYSFNLVQPNFFNDVKGDFWAVLNIDNKLNRELEEIKEKHHSKECKKATEDFDLDYTCTCKLPSKEDLKKELYKKHYDRIKARLEEWEKRNRVE